jgi:subtilisin family serine protease
MEKVLNRNLLITQIVVCIFSFQQILAQNIKIIKKGNEYYLSNKVVVKLKTLVPTGLNKSITLSHLLTEKLSNFQVQKVEKTFSDNGSENNSLSNIVTIDYLSDIDPQIAASKISKLDGELWAEPKYVDQVDAEFIPNDPSYALQWNLQKIQAQQAWDITQGDTSVVIGIVDTGVQWDHPDIATNIWINNKEIPNNGIDDDKNGYVDDYRGWDFGGLDGTPDNNPTEDRSDHGTHVAGIASAVTNNEIGIASIGFKCKLMVVKATQDNIRNPTTGEPPLIYPWEGVKYAIDNGAKIINCSWGGYSFSRANQEVVNYALSKGVLIVAAAGNNNITDVHYPSGYEGVLSVASTGQEDIKSSFSNYGYSVDVSAPGEGIYSTWKSNTYTYLSGTSMSTPLVAGLAGLVKTHFPNMSPIQIGEQIRVNCDNIDSKNPKYTYMLGGGRVNAYKALTNTTSESVRAYSFNFTDKTAGGNNDGIFSPGEELQLDVKFRNILNPTANLAISIQDLSGYATIENPSLNVGIINSMDSIAHPFKFIIKQNAPYNQIIDLILYYSDDTYSDYQVLSVTVNPSYITQDGNKIAMTINSRGNLGFNDYPNNLQGNGFIYNDKNLMFEGALMYGNSASKINNVARSGDQSVQDKDFSIIRPFNIANPGEIADMEGISIFDDHASAVKLGLETKLHSYSFADSPNDKFIILRYNFKNKTGVNISNLFLGLFFDWDMLDGSNDKAEYDNSNNFGYVHHLDGEPFSYAGCALISAGNFGFYAIKNDSGDGGFGIYDGFTSAEKWKALSNGIFKKQSGPGDISMVVSSGPYTINAGDSIDVAFAVAAGDSLGELQNAIIASRSKYSQILTSVENRDVNKPVEFKLDQNYPNPFNPITTITYQIPLAAFVTLKVFDILGKEVTALVNEEKPAGKYKVEFDGSNLSSGIYFYKLHANNFVDTKKLILLK